MDVTEYTVKNIILSSWTENKNNQKKKSQKKYDFLRPLRQWLDNIQVRDRNLAHRLCKAIPTQCPFQRDLKLFGRLLVSIPPLCKLNPLYNEIVALRFRAICYLADECGEDVSAYC